MKVTRLIFSTAAVLLLLSAKVSACSCAFDSPCQVFSSASAIFIGEMVGGTEKVDMGRETGSTSYEAGEVRFIVEETFKGNPGTEVTISVKSHKNSSCGPYGLIKGQRYIVYAYGESGHLSTGVCTLTRPLSMFSEEDDDFQFLKNLPKAGSGGRLTVSVSADRGMIYKPFRDVAVILKNGEKQPIQGITNAEGVFEISNLRAGKYEVEALWPNSYSSTNSKAEVDVHDRGCATINFVARPDTILTGLVFDSRFRPASVMLNLVPIDLQSDVKPMFIYGRSDEDGNFQIKGTPPGKYLLYFNLHADDFRKNMKYFYPGTPKSEEATVIEIGSAQKLERYDFQIPKEFNTQIVKGQVLWPDGKPAAGVEVMLLCPRSTQAEGYILNFGSVTTETDEEGFFTLNAYTATVYNLEARSSKIPPSEKEPPAYHSPAHPLIVEEDIKGMKVVLSEAGLTGNGCSRRSVK